MEAPWDLTWYMAHLDHYRPRRLRLRLYCAPEWADEVAYRLGNQGVQAHVTGEGRVEVWEHRSLCALLSHLRPSPALERSLDEYKAACDQSRRGVVTPPAVAEAQIAACRHVMSFWPGLTRAPRRSPAPR